MQEYRGIKLDDSVNIQKERVRLYVEEFSSKCKEKNVTCLSEFKGSKETIKLLCNFCREIKEVKVTNFMKSKNCVNCYHLKRLANSKDSFFRILEEKEIKTLEPFVNSTKKIKLCCKKGHVFSKKPSELKWNGCPMCGREKTNSFLKEKSKSAKSEVEVYAKENGYTILSKIGNMRQQICVDFNCGHEPHWVTSHDFKRGHGCPHCRESKGEVVIREYLERLGIEYKTQLKLLNNKLYDIYIPTYNLIVEVHGIQHYEHSYFHEASGKTIEQEQENDRLKEEYARSLGYEYMIIDYREHNPQLALERFKKQFKEFKERN